MNLKEVKMEREACLKDVLVCALESTASQSFPTIEGYLVGVETSVPYPSRYVYPGCTFLLPTRRFCATSVRGIDNTCGHQDPTKEPLSRAMFRFDTFIVDKSIGRKSIGRMCPPLRATLFDGAALTLLDTTALEFEKLSEMQQDRWVNNVISMHKFPFVKVTLHVKHGHVSVSSLSLDENVAELLPSYNRPNTPIRNVKAKSPVSAYFKSAKSEFRGPSSSGENAYYKSASSEFGRATSSGEKAYYKSAKSEFGGPTSSGKKASFKSASSEYGGPTASGKKASCKSPKNDIAGPTSSGEKATSRLSCSTLKLSSSTRSTLKLSDTVLDLRRRFDDMMDELAPKVDVEVKRQVIVISSDESDDCHGSHGMIDDA